MWRLFGEFILHSNSQSFPILAITLKEHGGVRGEARFPPLAVEVPNNIKITTILPLRHLLILHHCLQTSLQIL